MAKSTVLDVRILKDDDEQFKELKLPNYRRFQVERMRSEAKPRHRNCVKQQWGTKLPAFFLSRSSFSYLLE